MANALIERIEEGLRETGGTLMDTRKVQDLLLDILIEARKVDVPLDPNYMVVEGDQVELQ